jgi:hypothetical protein
MASHFGYNTTVFPLTAGATLATADTPTNTILRYYSNIIQANLGAAFAADAAQCNFLHASLNYIVDGSMVAQAVSFPVSSTLKITDYKFPLLSVYRTKRDFVQHSSLKVMIESQYDVCFILPPLTTRQFNFLYKYLELVSDVLVTRTWQGFDPLYNSGEQVWKSANIAYAEMHNDQYGSFLGADGSTEFPSIKLNIKMMEETQNVLSDFNSLNKVSIEVDLYDGYNLSNPVKNITDGYVNPNLGISSLSVSSGSIAGGTLVTILGAGFQNINSSLTPSFAATFNNVPVNSLIVKDTNTMLVKTGAASQTGIGNVILTDILGNSINLVDGWTYHS